MKTSLFLSFLLLTSCGEKLAENFQNKYKKAPLVIPHSLTETFEGLDGKTYSLADFSDRPVVLQFTGFRCATCETEIQDFKNALRSAGIPPTKIYLITLVSAKKSSVREDAQTWQEWQEMPWLVGLDPGFELLYKYCGFGAATPCLVIQKDNKISVKIGTSSAAEVKAITGPWED